MLSVSLLVVPAAPRAPGWSGSEHLVLKQLQNPVLPFPESFHIIPLALPRLTFLLPTGRLAGSFTRQPCGLIESLPPLTAGEVLDVPTGEGINHSGLTRCFEVKGTGGRAFPCSAASPIAWEGQKSTECVQPKGCLWQLLPAAQLGARGCSEMELRCGTSGRRPPAFPVLLLQQKAEWQSGGKKGVATSPRRVGTLRLL